MKIYRFTDTTGHQRTINEQHPEAVRAYKSQAHFQSGVTFDRVEISEEARRRFERLRIVELNRARSKKIAGEYLPLIQQGIEPGDDSTISHNWKIQSLGNAVRQNRYDFNDAHVIHETAQVLQIQLLAS